MFNVFFNEELVIPNVDIYALVGKNTPLDIIISFSTMRQGSTEYITVRGHSIKPVNGTNPVLSICVGDCRLDKRFFWEVGNYILSAFSVVKIDQEKQIRAKKGIKLRKPVKDC